jgi:hypothetical protein
MRADGIHEPRLAQCNADSSKDEKQNRASPIILFVLRHRRDLSPHRSAQIPGARRITPERKLCSPGPEFDWRVPVANLARAVSSRL